MPTMSQTFTNKSATLSFVESEVTVKVKVTRNSSTDSLTSLPDTLEYEPTTVSYSPLLLFTSFIAHMKHYIKSYEIFITYPIFVCLCLWNLIKFLRSDPKTKKKTNKVALAMMGLSFMILIVQAVLMFAMGVIGCLKSLKNKVTNSAALLFSTAGMLLLAAFFLF